MTKLELSATPRASVGNEEQRARSHSSPITPMQVLKATHKASTPE